MSNMAIIDVYQNQSRLVTKTGSRGWQARLTIGFFKSVFIFVGAFPPSTVPTTSPKKMLIILEHLTTHSTIKLP